MESRRSTKIFLDGADLELIRVHAPDERISGFTTNPTLMKQAGVTNYREFAEKLLRSANGKPVSFEVLSDEIDEMRKQAVELAEWGTNVFVKIPCMTTRGESTVRLVNELVDRQVQVNVTAVFTKNQISDFAAVMSPNVAGNISVFAGRIADAGQDPIPYVRFAVEQVEGLGSVEIIWASPREVLNYIQAQLSSCHIITVTPDLFKKFSNLGKDLEQYSLETVRMFVDDARAAGITF